jgi:hypothetical protein
MSIYLTDANNDTYLDSNNHIARATTNITEVQQLVTNKLRTFLREVFTDISIGTDWFGIMLTNLTSLASKNAELTRVIMTVPKVVSVDNIEYKQNAETREISFYITITCVYGTFTITDLTLGV